MNADLERLNDARRHLAAAWDLLAQVNAPVAATGPNENAKHAREQLVSVMDNVEVLRSQAGGNRHIFEPGDRVLITASIEQGITGVVARRVGSDCLRIHYWGSRWVELCWWQMVNLSR